MRDNRRPRYKEVNIKWVFETIQDRLEDPVFPDTLLYSYIEQVQYTICNYINRNYVPEPLKYVVLNMTFDLLKSETLNGMLDNDSLGDINIGSLSKIEDGDSQIQFKSGNSANSIGAHIADVDLLLYNYRLQLDKYRLTKW